MKWLQVLVGLVVVGACCAYMVAFSPLPWPQWLAGSAISCVGGALAGNALARIRYGIK